MGAVGTDDDAVEGPEDTVLHHVPPPPESARLRRIREREERGDRWVPGLPKSAAEALRKALAWQAEIDVGLRRSDIARRERITRARVTQILSLLDLPEEVRAMLLAEDPEVEDWSVRRALATLR